MNVDEKRIKHLEFIQAIINRMASMSLAIKGFTVTIIGIIISLMPNADNLKIPLFSILLIILFSFLDCYYLKLERDFRKLYAYVCKAKEIDFSMNLAIIQKERFIKTFISISIVPFYLLLVVFNIGIIVYIFN